MGIGRNLKLGSWFFSLQNLANAEEARVPVNPKTPAVWRRSREFV
jgi:hypothetical protein